MASEIDDNISLKALPPHALELGYPTLAAYMGGSPEISIFRRFADLNTQTLLHYQAELFSLEACLREQEAAAAACDDDDPKSRFLRDWEWSTTDVNISDQMKISLRIRTVLRDYNELLLQQAGLAVLPKPGSYDLYCLQEWLDDPDGGNFPLIGPDRKWVFASDLLAIRRRADSDPFSKWVSEKLLPCYHRRLGRHLHRKSPDKYNEVKYKDSGVLKAASLLATTLATFLIIAPVIALYEISSMGARLGVMACFTVLFSLCITSLTNARRSEVFAATAAQVIPQPATMGEALTIE